MISFLKHCLSNAKLAGVGIILISAAALSAAFTAQYGFGIKPCILCLIQRVPYAIEILLGLIIFVLARRGNEKAAALGMFLSALVFLAGGIVASYHVGVEHHWWVSFLEGCSADFSASTPEDLMKQIAATPAVRCDRVPWSLFGISMAGYNAMASTVFSMGSLLSSILIVRKANGLLD